MQETRTFLYIFPQELRGIWGQVEKEYSSLEEIRIRADKPVVVKFHDREVFINESGGFTAKKETAYRMGMGQIQDVMMHICHDSLYAFEDEIKQGFLTVLGGHRVGLVGQAVLADDGRVRTLKHISGINIRIAHEVKGAADPVLPFLFEGDKLCNTLIISPPGCGKTTLLRDIIRQVSDGYGTKAGCTIGVVDERSEIAGSYLGIPQNDVGIRTDVLDGCPKVYGMMMLLRAMSPQIIAIDELGDIEDVKALKRASACGCGLIATIHGSDMEEMSKKTFMREVMDEEIFSRYVILEKAGGRARVKKICKKEPGEICYGY